MFSGEEVFKTVNMLSGGERVRLALCKILMSKPNFLILDEPTNHMDIIGKETLENLLLGYSGTLIFVSHDRYFISRIAKSLLHFSKNGTELFPYGYTQYSEKQKNNSLPTQTKLPTVREKTKKGFTTPLKEKAKKERAIKKAEERIALLEEKSKNILEELALDENISDYVKLAELQKLQEETETELLEVLDEWEKLSQDMDLMN